MSVHTIPARLQAAPAAGSRNRLRRSTVSVPAGLAVVQLVLAYEWLISGMNKLFSPNFTVQLASTLKQNMSSNPYGWYVSFLRDIVLPHSSVFGLLTQLGELLIGVALLASAALWLIRPQSWSTQVAARAACLALAGAIVLPLNYFLMSGDPLPWLNPANAFNEGVSIDALMALLAAPLLIANLQAVLSGRAPASAEPTPHGGEPWAA